MSGRKRTCKTNYERKPDPHWWLPLDNVSYMDIEEASEAKNVEMLDVNAAAYGWPRPGE